MKHSELVEFWTALHPGETVNIATLTWDNVLADARRVAADTVHLKAQIDDLAAVLLAEFGGPADESACEMAVRVLREQRAEIEALLKAEPDAESVKRLEIYPPPQVHPDAELMQRMDRCPGCGSMDRYSPAGTACLPGWHYGAFSGR
jgi:hypothetical protein